MHKSNRYRAIVLAGERENGNALAKHFGVTSSVMLEVADKPILQRVVETLSQSHYISQSHLSGPDASVKQGDERLQRLITQHQLHWIEPGRSPAASAHQAIDALELKLESRGLESKGEDSATQPGPQAWQPILVTAADHGLLTPAMVDNFCSQVDEQQASIGPDFVVGLVPHSLVTEHYPNSKRTQLKFAEGSYCGANLFAVCTPHGQRVLDYWQQMESFRKQPWQMARRLGLMNLWRYALGRLTLDQAVARVGELTGCRINYCLLPFAQAAIDVDSLADWQLAEQILKHRDGVAGESTPAAGRS